MTDILAQIDAAIGCHQCEGSLGDSPSGDFCSELCQARWSAERVGEEPDLDAYQPASWFPGIYGFEQQQPAELICNGDRITIVSGHVQGTYVVESGGLEPGEPINLSFHPGERQLACRRVEDTS